MKISLVKTAVISLLFWTAGVHAYTVQDGTVYDDANHPIQLQGVNWFGFETSDRIVNGLWARNWQSMIDQMKSLGFNAVRIPVCPDTLVGASATNYDRTLNPDLVGKNSLQILDAVLAEFDRQQFYILLDHHRLNCNAGISELWYESDYSAQSWISDLKFMANRYKSLPHFIGIDLKNEPHGAATWGTGNASTDWNGAAAMAATAVLNAAPDILVFVEGVEGNPVCGGTTAHWWGGNLEPLSCYPLNIPSNKLVLAPHVYGPDVYEQTYFSDPTFPDNMPAIWDAHFGQFKKAGYTLAIGEIGGKYGHGGDPKDVKFQNALIAYLKGKGITNLFYWSWNPNSGDTGGILQDDWTAVWQDKVNLLASLWGLSGSGTTTTTTTQPTTTTTPVVTPPTPTGTTSLAGKTTINSDWGTGYCATVTVLNSTPATVFWNTSVTIQGTVNNLWNAGYTQSGSELLASGLSWNNTVASGASVTFGFCATRPASTSTTTSAPAAPATSTNGITSVLSISSDWGAGYCAQVNVTNGGNTATQSWQVTQQVGGRINNLWNAVYTQSGSTLTASSISGQNNVISAGGTTQFGFCATR
ncbi:cellulase family glycosylhydrolase [Candidatus Methylospira mobilis]|uniref:cellulase family glycosylhydrolase n=1 Tax=Candidatus Methylospira mobilis TaxID=1808979 RepID=UPI0028E94A6C|nr:cellulase family glycosylhydrolase [Candidatus Methylospira mobilis]WNV06608.1 cellulase family glycosylhydrolase [Candidatus Methylospira mobilis]